MCLLPSGILDLPDLSAYEHHHVPPPNGMRISRRRAEQSEAKPVGWMRVLASAPFSRQVPFLCTLLEGTRLHALAQPCCFRRYSRLLPAFTLYHLTHCIAGRLARRSLRQNAPLWFVNLLARCRIASHALLCRRSYAECHTAQVVSRDGGFRPAVPLPAVAILSCTHFFSRKTRIKETSVIEPPDIEKPGSNKKGDPSPGTSRPHRSPLQARRAWGLLPTPYRPPVPEGAQWVDVGFSRCAESDAPLGYFYYTPKIGACQEPKCRITCGTSPACQTLLKVPGTLTRYRRGTSRAVSVR